jgi:hypothetical protein
MRNTSTPDNFERISEDLVDLLILAIGSLTEQDEQERKAAKLVLSMAAEGICKRAIALTA